ncbi:MAG TPA: FHA domain-containing protein [Longimicrobium sp.]
MTESKNTPEEGTASTTPLEEAPLATPTPEEGTASMGAAPSTGDTAAATPAPVTETPAVDADATLISPPPADATLESPAATSTEGGAVVEAPPAESGTEAPASEAPTTETATEAPAAEAPPVEAPAAELPTTETPAEVPAAEALTPPSAPATDASAGAPAAVPPTLPADPPGGALRSERINLVSSAGQAMTVGVRTPLGKHVVRRFGEESNVWDTEQCVLERGPDGAWQIVPGEGTTNETLLNGEAITSPRPLHDGDVIAVGRVEKGIVKLPLTARQG